jgi:aryl-alcohol dehydrogenase-like predicted oxidoreductase
VITGASRVAQVEENMRALDVVEALADDVMERIDGILDNRPKPASDFRA